MNSGLKDGSTFLQKFWCRFIYQLCTHICGCFTWVLWRVLFFLTLVSSMSFIGGSRACMSALRLSEWDSLCINRSHYSDFKFSQFEMSTYSNFTPQPMAPLTTFFILKRLSCPLWLSRFVLLLRKRKPTGTWSKLWHLYQWEKKH